MTFALADTPRMHARSSDPPLLPFWAWSGLLHLGIVILFSLIPTTSHIEKTPSVVHVTLIEQTTPSPAPSPSSEPPKKKSAPQTPPMLQAQRPVIPTPPKTRTMSKPLTTATVPITMAQVAIPEKPRKPSKAIDRSPLRDPRADTQVELTNYLKVARRTPVSRSYSPPTTQKLDAASTGIPIPANIPSPPVEGMTIRDSPSPTRSLNPNILKATVPGLGTIGKSKVGLGRTIPPIYPRIARESGWEGTVLVRVAVQPDGNPEEIEVRKSSGYPVLDDAAVEAVKKWHFSPAKDGNIPIRSVVEIPINFDLRKQG